MTITWKILPCLFPEGTKSILTLPSNPKSSTVYDPYMQIKHHTGVMRVVDAKPSREFGHTAISELASGCLTTKSNALKCRDRLPSQRSWAKLFGSR